MSIISANPRTPPVQPVAPSPAIGADTLKPAIQVSGLGMIYPGPVAALADVDLVIPKGQHVALLGSSGSGKTTLVGCLSGRLHPTAGQVTRHGTTAVIYQDLRLVKQRTAIQNVLHGSMGHLPLWQSMFHFPQREKLRAIELLKRVGLGHRIHAVVGRLSGGEQQRVAIARALMQNPEILFADEPVANLDNVNAESIMRLMRDLSRERNLTLISVLHDCTLAETYADRICGLDQGRLVYDHETRLGLTQPFEPCRACQTIISHPAKPSGTTDIERPAWMKPLAFVSMLLIVALIYLWAATGLDISSRQMQGAWSGLSRFVGDMTPKSWAQVAGIPWKTLAWSLLQTIQMSIIGTTLGVIISWPLAALAANNVGPRWIRPTTRFILNTIRTIPSLIWALLFVAAVGIGSLAGVLALVAYSVGYLTKFFYEAFEAVDPGPPDALGEIGACGLQKFLHAVWPASRPGVLSSSLFMLEYNVRAASVLGIVGAGGIGYYIAGFLEWRNFSAALACLVMLLAVVLVLDAISTRVRARLVRP